MTEPDGLAIFGMPPVFPEPLHVGRPNLGDQARFFDRMAGMFERNWLTNDGPLTREFEREVAAFLGVRHCVAMCNGTVALEIAIRALGLRGEVIVPAFTFVATAHALQWQEITPVFCDVDPRTHNIDPQSLESMITPRTSGILGVHLWGRPCNVEALQDIAQRRDLRLVFDAAHAFGSSHHGAMIGSFGDAEVFSFHATKVLNSFEGGAVVTNNDEVAEKCALMRNFGFSGVDRVTFIGTNGKMSEASAAMGLTSLESFSRFVDANARNYSTYAAGINHEAIRLIDYGEGDLRSRHYVVIEVEDHAPLTRDELWQVLVAENVLARRYFFPGAHRMEPYASLFPHAALLLPNAERLAARVLVLPTGTTISTSDIGEVCAIIKRAFAMADAVRERLASLQIVPEVGAPTVSGGEMSGGYGGQ